jgi:DnaJ-class molecular chaperone
MTNISCNKCGGYISGFGFPRYIGDFFCMCQPEPVLIDVREKHDWQLCPKCEGSGQAMNARNEIPMYTDTCDVCDGKKIISKQTGKPPCI